MNADGTDPVRVTDSPSVEREPDWQPLPPRFVVSDFEYPVDSSGVNVANAGQSIPLRYRLTDANGMPSDDPAHFVSVTSTSDATCGGGTPDAIETYVGDSGLRYLGDGYWQFNWKTPKSYAGDCRSMTLNIASGAPRRAVPVPISRTARGLHGSQDEPAPAVAWRLAVSIRAVGDVRRGGDGPDRAAS
jgi:hypothetical protein